MIQGWFLFFFRTGALFGDFGEKTMRFSETTKAQKIWFFIVKLRKKKKMEGHTRKYIKKEKERESR